MSRRVFLKSTAAAGAGLTLGIYVADAAAQMSGPGKTVGAAAAGAFEPNAFVRIGKDNTVTVVVKHLEMGQGVYTGLPTLVAEELDAAWSQVRVEGAPADAKRYNNLLWGAAQGTGGSTAIANSFEQYRQAGAAARAMLVAAAATAMEGARRKHPGEERRADPRQREEGDLRRACRRRGASNRCRPGSSSRTRRTSSTSASTFAAHGLEGEVERHRALHAGREAARHADRGRAARAALRPEGRQGRLIRRDRASPACATWSRSRPAWR